MSKTFGAMAETDEERRSILAREFTKVNIYFETFKVTNIGEDAKYDFSKTLSDLGGAAGLYLGICVVTLLEILELILSLCKSSIRFLCCRSSGKMQDKTTMGNVTHLQASLGLCGRERSVKRSFLLCTQERERDSHGVHHAI
ncbi:unnamed protein product [Notodromas monacha]|uniref:Uncharacterized protein n=1 Tax=Notodromas monacha TaxID=399045 RepID=A0A7R9BXW4_9CRUS|nr:unnamed protein product [Notodromas monacha]CAG0923703.1 unnamed protein product [Notodromas monacha]